jgi:hypothetical protein
MIEYKIRAVIFQEGPRWVAQCLEYGLATQAARLEDLPHELMRLLAVQIAASLECGVEPFFGFSPAPRRYWEMYENARARLLPVEGHPAPNCRLASRSGPRSTPALQPDGCRSEM